MSRRTYHNNIQALIDNAGDCIYKPAETETEAINYYTTLFNGDIKHDFPIQRCRSYINEEGK